MAMTDLIERAASIRPILEQSAEEADRLRRLPDVTVQALKDTGLCRLMVPKRFGGYETDIHTYIAVMAELGRGCGATSWVASLDQRLRVAGESLSRTRAAGHLGGAAGRLDRRLARAPRRRRRRSTAAGA